MNPKLLICGYGRHGKDTVAEIIQDELSLTFISSSMFAAEIAVMPYLASKGIHYDTVHDAYEDRHRYRAEWKQAISEHNTPDKGAQGSAAHLETDEHCSSAQKDDVGLHRCPAGATEKVF